MKFQGTFRIHDKRRTFYRSFKYRVFDDLAVPMYHGPSLPVDEALRAGYVGFRNDGSFDFRNVVSFGLRTGRKLKG